MRRLTLVRHSLPAIARGVAAREWPLSAEGSARARAFARRLRPADGARLFSSCEPKAVETARELAAEWGLEFETVTGLHEHERPDVQLMPREAFERSIRMLFERRSELVFGSETADAARRRFTGAVMRLVARTTGDVLVVSHGTVMTLFVAEVSGVEPFMFWKRQTMPFAVTLTLPELRIESTTSVEHGTTAC